MEFAEKQRKVFDEEFGGWYLVEDLARGHIINQSFVNIFRTNNLFKSHPDVFPDGGPDCDKPVWVAQVREDGFLLKVDDSLVNVMSFCDIFCIPYDIDIWK